MCYHITEFVIKKELVNSSNLQSVSLNAPWRMYRLSLNVGEWRRKREVDSISKPELQIRFKKSSKLCLNLGSYK